MSKGLANLMACILQGLGTAHVLPLGVQGEHKQVKDELKRDIELERNQLPHLVISNSNQELDPATHYNLIPRWTQRGRVLGF